MKLLQTMLVAAVIASPLAAFAQSTSTPRVDQRQAKQERRIEQGTQSGALTGREAARLDRGQERVQTMEDKAKADGKVTRTERVRLHAAQDAQSARIYSQKHDRQHDLNHNGKIDRPARRVR
jgi:outer membrane lipoprotein SlyB